MKILKLAFIFLIMILWIPFSGSYLLYAQIIDGNGNKNYLLLVNKQQETLEKFEPGDRVRIKLIDHTVLSGPMDRIDSGRFSVGAKQVSYADIKKIRKLRNRTVEWIIGSVLVTGGITTLAILSKGDTDFSDIPVVAALGAGLTAGGIAILIPFQLKIGPSRSLVMMKGP